MYSGLRTVSVEFMEHLWNGICKLVILLIEKLSGRLSNVRSAFCAKRSDVSQIIILLYYMMLSEKST